MSRLLLPACAHVPDTTLEPDPPAVVFAPLQRPFEGARLTTESCLLTDPGALLSVSDEVRGNWIKVVIGLVILAAVLAFSIHRLRVRQRQLAARSSLDR